MFKTKEQVGNDMSRASVILFQPFLIQFNFNTKVLTVSVCVWGGGEWVGWEGQGEWKLKELLVR